MASALDCTIVQASLIALGLASVCACTNLFVLACLGPFELEADDVFFDELFTRLDFDEAKAGKGFDCVLLASLDVGHIAPADGDEAVVAGSEGQVRLTHFPSRASG